jgi:hypothetical protein
MNTKTALALALGTAALSVTTAPVADAAPDRGLRTTLTFAVDDCEGCEVQLHQGRDWSSQERTVRNGKVSFTMPSKRTWGMSTTVRAPWEGHTGYLTTVAFRYGGKQVGDPVTPAEARAADAASACWAGTRSRRVTVPLVVERVRVDGVRGRVAGSIAYTPTTEDWTSPLRSAYDGVLGSQDLDECPRG